MKKIKAFLVALLLPPLSALADINVIPLPTRVVEKTGSFVIKPNATIATRVCCLQPNI